MRFSSYKEAIQVLSDLTTKNIKIDWECYKTIEEIYQESPDLKNDLSDLIQKIIHTYKNDIIKPDKKGRKKLYSYVPYNDNTINSIKYSYKDTMKFSDYGIQIYSNPSIKPDDNLNFIELFTTKHKAWEYENEYRVITYGIDKIYLPITAIYFGREIDPANKDSIIKLIKDQQKNIDLYDMKVSQKNVFDLESSEYK